MEETSRFYCGILGKTATNVAICPHHSTKNIGFAVMFYHGKMYALCMQFLFRFVQLMADNRTANFDITTGFNQGPFNRAFDINIAACDHLHTFGNVAVDNHGAFKLDMASRNINPFYGIDFINKRGIVS